MDATVERIKPEGFNYIELTAGIVSAYVANNSVPVAELPTLIASTHAALASLGHGGAPVVSGGEKLTPAQIRKSIRPDALISFEDGKPYKTLRRHLTRMGLTPEAYRKKWGLPRDYPLVAASYSEHRSALAKSTGLGQQRALTSKDLEADTEKPKRAGQPQKARASAET